MAHVITWNVAGRVRSVERQLEALAERSYDVIALQEVRRTALPEWRDRLIRLGYLHVVTSMPEDRLHASPERRLGVLIAARRPLEPSLPLSLPWPERHLAVWAELDGVITELHNLHAPLSNRAGEVKVRTLETVFEHLRVPSSAPRILLGDLNTPRYESREGEVLTFARTRAGNLRPGYGERHDAAERALVVDLREHGFVDAFRSLHGYARRDGSWLYPSGLAGYRLDHILVRGLAVAACDYEHRWRVDRLSDHSAIWAEIVTDAA